MRKVIFVYGILIGFGTLLSGCGESGMSSVAPSAISQSRSAMLSLGEPGVAEIAVPAAVSENNAAAATSGKKNRDPLTDSARIAKEAKRTSPLRILVVGAHPADIFDQSAGTMAHHVERGDWVGCAVLTHGSRVHDKVVSDEMFHREKLPDAEEMKKIILERADVKTKEILKACSILGVKEKDVYFMGADDAVLLVNEPMIRQLARLIRKLRPTVVITHYPLEDGGIASQHATTGQMVMHAINFARGVDPGDKSPPCKVSQVFYFGIGAAATRTDLMDAQGGFYNDIFVDITDVAAKKIACLDAVASQGYGGAYARKRIEMSDGAFGSRVKVAYAEGFISAYSTTQYYLPVSELDLEYAKDSDHETINRSSYRIKVPQ